jgi:hypothetical protein
VRCVPNSDDAFALKGFPDDVAVFEREYVPELEKLVAYCETRGVMQVRER